MLPRPLRLALAAGLSTLLLSFFLINIIGVLWASYENSHDGQGGIGLFFMSLYAAPALALIAFSVAFWKLSPRRSGDRRRP